MRKIRFKKNIPVMSTALRIACLASFFCLYVTLSDLERTYFEVRFYSFTSSFGKGFFLFEEVINVYFLLTTSVTDFV